MALFGPNGRPGDREGVSLRAGAKSAFTQTPKTHPPLSGFLGRFVAKIAVFDKNGRFWSDVEVVVRSNQVIFFLTNGRIDAT